MGIPPTRLSLVGSGSSPYPAGAPSFLETALPRVLSLDAHGRILDWMHWQDAVCLYVRGAVAWTLGEPCLVVRGGTNRASGLQSFVELHPIVAGRSHAQAKALDPSPSLSNTALFARDRNLCMYCGKEYGRHSLTRDHVVPVSRGGRDVWENVVCACFHCNSRKGGRTPQQAGMPIRRAPHRPSAWQLQEFGRRFPPHYLHQSWLDYLYWDIELDP